MDGRHHLPELLVDDEPERLAGTEVALALQDDGGIELLEPVVGSAAGLAPPDHPPARRTDGGFAVDEGTAS
jgi:hypothetical protein